MASKISVDQTRAEEPYITELNGGTNRAPPWPQPQFDNEDMFLLPKKLNSGENITIRGSLKSEPRLMTVALITGYNSPDYQNIACEVEVKFPSNNGEDRIVIKIVQNGAPELVNDSNTASACFDESDFSMRFNVQRNGSLDIYIGPSFLESIPLKHNIEDIRFLAVSGDVKIRKLEFDFV